MFVFVTVKRDDSSCVAFNECLVAGLLTLRLEFDFE